MTFFFRAQVRSGVESIVLDIARRPIYTRRLCSFKAACRKSKNLSVERCKYAASQKAARSYAKLD